jgi:hypothetical protein
MSAIPDPRHIANGWQIPTESYSDQPYIVRTDDGAWLCAVTTGPGEEGARGQHVITLRSADRGQTWSAPVPVEPGDDRENAYAVMLKVPPLLPRHSPLDHLCRGRIYVFYNHNTDNVREVKRHDGKPPFERVDSLGHFVFKYSDDHGRSWSPQRYDIPLRAFACDRDNVYGGALKFFWNVGRSFIHEGSACVPLIKVGQMGEGFFAQSEGALLRSENLLQVSDPAEATWQTLPEGDVGLRTPPGGGPISEEQSYCLLSDGSIHCVYRSIDGHPVQSYSRDGGRTWSAPRYMRFADGRAIKHPRAANFAWRCENGRFLYWFHNHGGKGYEDRNPVWLSGGIEVDTPRGREIAWSQPEIALYDDDPLIRISYPDLVEDDGKYYLTETQKHVARVHELDRALLEGMWASLDALPRSSATPGTVSDKALRHAGRSQSRGSVRQGIPAEAGTPTPHSSAARHALPALLRKAMQAGGAGLVGVPPSGGARPATDPLLDLADPPAEVAMPRLPVFLSRDWSCRDMRSKDERAGFSLELWLTLRDTGGGQALLDSRRTGTRQGLLLQSIDGGALQLAIGDERQSCVWQSDPVLKAGQRHHVVAVVDGGPKVVSFIIDGRLNDGGEWRQFGWGRFSSTLFHANGSETLRVGAGLRGRIHRLRLYGTALRAYEALARTEA